MTPLAELLAERIRRYGPITFADYMRECLYHPVHGYYSKKESQRFADYYTSVDVHPVFGRLLARQFAEMWERLGRPAEFLLVEAGAGVGRLAEHILDFCEARLPEFHRALCYVAVERSLARREEGAAHLKRQAKACPTSSSSSSSSETRLRISQEIPLRIPVGCVFSNELIDALPVHRVVMRADGLKEIFVGLREGKFVDVEAPVSTCAINEYFVTQAIALQEGQQAEAGLEACDWISEVGRRLERGYVLTIDYGHPAAELFDERHMRGTLLAYREHRVSEDFYATPGEQDLTAHVNFTSLETWGRRSGLERERFVSQTEFLLALGERNEFADLYDPGQSEADQIRARLQLKTLIHPEGMGERFQVLVQRKGLEGTLLKALGRDNKVRTSVG
ncbi:MAG TPA: SAM-dependent methyltransferase [Candidatus Acidoferrum sp.]|nr:SAM-dependent methyltransferase [Candidatus Acidoferrum sp.]